MAELVRRNTDTDPVIFTLQSVDPDSGAVSAVNLTGMTLIEMRLLSFVTGTTKSFDTDGAQLSISDAAAGQVTFLPDAADWDVTDQFYRGYFWVTDGLGDLISFPSDGTFLISLIESP